MLFNGLFLLCYIHAMYAFLPSHKWGIQITLPLLVSWHVPWCTLIRSIRSIFACLTYDLSVTGGDLPAFLRRYCTLDLFLTCFNSEVYRKHQSLSTLFYSQKLPFMFKMTKTKVQGLLCVFFFFFWAVVLMKGYFT